jgi:hypothetical protein
MRVIAKGGTFAGAPTRVMLLRERTHALVECPVLSIDNGNSRENGGKCIPTLEGKSAGGGLIDALGEKD